MRWRLVVAVVLSTPLLGGCGLILKADTQEAQAVFDQALPGQYRVLWDQYADTSGLHRATVQPLDEPLVWLDVTYQPPAPVDGCPAGSDCADRLRAAVEEAERSD